MTGQEFFKPQNTEQRVLTRMRSVALAQYPKALADSMDLKIMEDHMTDMLLARLTAHVFAEDVAQHQHEVKFQTPASWWQHFKQDVLNPLMTKCDFMPLNVKMKTETKVVKETVHASYPFLPMEVAGDHIMFSTWEGPWTE